MSASSAEAGYLEVSILIPSDKEELLSDFIIEEIASGLVTEDQGDDIKLICYLPLLNNPDEKVARIRRHLGRMRIVPEDQLEKRISSRKIKEIDWITQYQKEFKSVMIDDLVIKTPWDQGCYDRKIVITIEPKMAFGTGKHETTQLCLQAIKKELKKGMKILDLGTGSGVLAIYAAKLGASEILGLDIDPEAIPNARENAHINGVAEIFQVSPGSMEMVRVKNYYDLVISNLIKAGILNLFDSFRDALRPKGVMILSGILEDQKEEMTEFFQSKPVRDMEIMQKNEWLCYILRMD